MPIESINVKIRSEVSTILGFCDLIIELKNKDPISDEDLMNYLKMMRESAKEIENILDNMFLPKDMK